MKRLHILILTAVMAYLTNCKPEQFTTNANDKLNFSFDTILFDTILSKLYVGTPKSVNRQFLVRNTHDKKIKTTISLASGNKSQFRINIDGDAGTHFENIEIRPHDSLFVFVEAYANPNNDPNGNALIIRDSITFLTNGNIQDVKLIAWGQDAHYYYKDSTSSDLVWDDITRPYVIYGYFYVKPNATLTIKKGVSVYCAPYSTLYTEGTLLVEGSVTEPVIFEGDRTSDKNSKRHYPIDYANIPGQWFGLRFGWPSKGNSLKHARIKNATYGIFIDSSSSDGKSTVVVNNTFIQNISASAILGTRSKVFVQNSVLSNCGSSCLYTYKGGDYELIHVTLSGYCDFGGGSSPALAVTNRLRNNYGQIIQTYPNLKFTILNSIVWGDLADEFGFDIDDKINPTLDPQANLLKTTNQSFGQSILKNVLNKDPKFKDFRKYRFDLDTLSAAKDIAIPIIPNDYLEKSRDAKPDAGAFERIE